MMKTIVVAVASMIVGTALGFIVCHTTVTYFRRKMRAMRLQICGGAGKKKMGVMDKILILECLILAAYTVADMIVFWHVGSEPTTLTGCVFGVCGFENGIMGWIKTNKDKAADPSGSAAGAEPPPERTEPPDVGQ